MVQVYASRLSVRNNEKYVISNDVFFDSMIASEALKVDKVVEELMYRIDGSTFIKDGYTMRTRDGEYLKLTYLSTGCKTAINAYANPNLLFDTVECGNNVHLYILLLPRGRVIIPNPPFSEKNFAVKCELITPDRKIQCNSCWELDENWVV